VTAVVDTSVLLRLLLPGDPRQIIAVEAYIRAAERSGPTLIVPPTTVSEVTYVLRGPRLALGRAKTAEAVRFLRALPLRFLDGDVIDHAVTLYDAVHDDWDDCIAAAYSLLRADGAILAYDRDFDRIPGIKRFEPPLVTS
jgi:predicted nucleic acid-binding protein